MKKTRRGITSTTLLLPPKNRARGIPDRSILRPVWTIAEIGLAAEGVPEIPFLASLYAFAGDRSNYWILQKALYNRAITLANQKNWPYQLRDVHGISSPYLEHLAVLVLDWDANPGLFKIHPEMFAICMRMTDRVWEKHTQGKFEDLLMVWLTWLREAARKMQSKLSELDDFAEWE